MKERDEMICSLPVIKAMWLRICGEKVRVFDLQ